MSDPDHPSADGDLFRGAWVLLGVGGLAALCLAAVGLYRWYHAAQLRPLD